MQGVCVYQGNNTKLQKKQSRVFCSKPSFLTFFLLWNTKDSILKNILAALFHKMKVDWVCKNHY